MKKLFEIPIYACSPSAFSIRVGKHKEALSSEHLQPYRKIDDDQIRQRLFYACHPFQLWDYNHIVGYIVMLSDGVDVFFELYLQAHGYHHKSRYHWRSTQKWFLENQSVAGYHFRLEEKDSSEAIRAKIHLWLDGMIRELVPSKYYVDRESFDNIDSIVDYSKLVLKG